MRIECKIMRLRLAAVSAALILSTVSFAADRGSKVDLRAMLESPEALKSFSLEWEYPPNSDLYLYGGGRLIVQASPVALSDDVDDPFVMKAGGVVPTCTAMVGIEEIRSLLQLLLDKQFLALPEKSYVYSAVAYTTPKLKLHTIIIDDGKNHSERTFGVGEYEGKTDSLPAEFAAIEDALRKIRDSALPPHEKPCGLAPAINFGH